MPFRSSPAAERGDDAAGRAYLQQQLRNNLARLSWREVGGALTECLILALVAVLLCYGIGELLQYLVQGILPAKVR